MDENGIVSARTPFFCDEHHNNDISDNKITLHTFRAPSGLRDFVADYQNPQQDNMKLFDPREYNKFDCNNQSAFSQRDFPLFPPHYNRGGPYKNTLLNLNPEYPTRWAPLLETIPVFKLKTSQNSLMNDRQYGCYENNRTFLSDKRMYNSSSFARNCNKSTF